MATESLIVELDAKTQKLDAKLRATERRLDELDGTTQKADSSLLSLSRTGELAAKGISSIAAAGAAAGAALLVATNKAVDYGKELSVASKRSKESVESLQGIAFAANTVGISLEKIGDIGKNTNEKIGEFVAEGSGGFNDFVTVMRLTKSEADLVANKLQHLSGPQVLQEMIRQMEDAGVSANEMSFALEGVASDATDLIPLLSDGGKEMLRLRGEFDDLNVTLTELDLKKIAEIGVETSKLAAATEGASNKMVAVLDEDIKTVIRFFTESADSMGALIVGAVKGYQAVVVGALAGIDNIFREAEILALEAQAAIVGIFGDSSEIEAEIAKLKEKDIFLDAFGVKEIGIQWKGATDAVKEYYGEIATQEEVAPTITTPSSGLTPGVANDEGQVQSIADRFKSEETLLAEKIAREEELLIEKLDRELAIVGENNELKLQLEDEFLSNMADLGVEADARKDVDSDFSGTGDQIQAIADRFKSEEDLLFEKLERELILIGDNQTLKEELLDEHLMNVVSLHEKAENEKLSNTKKSFKSEEKIEGLRVSLASRTAQTLLSGSLSTEQKLFSIVKDSAAAAIEAYGLTAAAKDVATLGTIVGTPIGGGGGGGAPSGASDGGSAPVQQAEIQQEEISTLNLSSQDEDSASVLTVRFATDSGDQLLDALAEGLNNNQRQGR